MAIKIIGNDEDVKRYREVLKNRGMNVKSEHPVYKKKPDEFRLLMGEIRQCSYSSDYSVSTKGKVDPDARLYIRGIANARIIDRLDEMVEPAGGDFKNFMSNPILLADHMYWCSSAMGQVTSLMPEYDGLHFEAWIGDPQSAPLTEKQREVRSLVAQGIIKTVSIGFIPNEIKAPTWDNEGRMLSPAVVLKWEMLELSLIPIPCNAGSTFEMRQYAEVLFNKNNTEEQKTLTESLKEFENMMKAESTTIQTLIFDKKKFTVEEAKKWARDHDFRDDKVDETEESIRLRQRDPNDFIEGSFRTIELTDGVKAVIGRLKDNLDMEKKLDELLDGMKTMTAYVEGINLNIQKHIDISTEILGHVDEKKKPCKKPEDGMNPCEDDEEEMKSLKTKVDSLEKGLTEVKDVLKALIEKL